MKRIATLIAFGVLLVTTFFTCARTTSLPSSPDSPQHRDGQFRNAAPRQPFGVWKTAGLWWRFFFDKPGDTVPAGEIPVVRLTRQGLLEAPDNSLFRLGHATVLLKIGGTFWLTDPVFGERASPVRWAGPKRFHAPPIALDDLPPITGVILSHNHYDHLDRETIARLADRAAHFLAPLGVGDQLAAWGVDPAKVRQLDWWQSVQVDGIRFVATPAQHFSGRGMGDTDRTLWASWAILADGLRVFFGADSGYFDGFSAIGERYGPFDITLLESGAYNAQWPLVHMQPEETVKAHRDLRGRCLVPIHNGTFDLAFHPWREPLERVSALAAQDGVRLSTPRMGERVDMAAPHPGDAWWRETP
jgi:L-ascorbate metabolism protein UlaG (beta-lactamase superfamily)